MREKSSLVMFMLLIYAIMSGSIGGVDEEKYFISAGDEVDSRT